MKRFYNFLLRKNIFLLLLFTAFYVPSFSQIGFNNPNPDSSALIDMKANDKGLLIPRMTTTERDLMTAGGKKVAHALMVFDTDRNMFFVYDTIASPDRWLAINPWVTEGNVNSNINITTTGNVGINTPGAPTAKLDVNGDIKSSGNINATGNVTASSATFTGAVNSNSVSTGTITTTGNITAGGTVTAAKFIGEGTIPVGGIIMWSGNPATIPSGWALCDGSNIGGFQTPDLTGKFVVGAGTYSEVIGVTTYNYNYAVGDTGGTAKHQLLEAEMPQHNHSFDIAEFHSDESESGTSGGGFQTGGGWTTIYTNSKGSNVPHENRPPYYVLAYIIRLP